MGFRIAVILPGFGIDMAQSRNRLSLLISAVRADLLLQASRLAASLGHNNPITEVVIFTLGLFVATGTSMDMGFRIAVILPGFGIDMAQGIDALRNGRTANGTSSGLAACLGASCILYCSPVHMGMSTLFVCSCIRDILGYPISNIRLPSNKNISLFYRVRLGFRRGRTIILVTELDIIGRAINITTIQIVSNIKCLPLQFDPDRHIIRDCLSKLVFLFAALICIIPRNSSTFRKS